MCAQFEHCWMFYFASSHFKLCCPTDRGKEGVIAIHRILFWFLQLPITMVLLTTRHYCSIFVFHIWFRGISIASNYRYVCISTWCGKIWFLYFVLCICVCVLKLLRFRFIFVLRILRYYTTFYRNASYVRSVRMIPSKTNHDSLVTGFVRSVSRSFSWLKTIASNAVHHFLAWKCSFLLDMIGSWKCVDFVGKVVPDMNAWLFPLSSFYPLLPISASLRSYYRFFFEKRRVRHFISIVNWRDACHWNICTYWKWNTHRYKIALPKIATHHSYAQNPIVIHIAKLVCTFIEHLIQMNMFWTSSVMFGMHSNYW